MVAKIHFFSILKGVFFKYSINYYTKSLVFTCFDGY